MRVVFRVDASLTIGAGHVMRCLTLAQVLAAEGAECYFICREHPGHMLDAIRVRGFGAHSLPNGAHDTNRPGDAPHTAHFAWLGTTWQEDARQSLQQIEKLVPDWLVVDHYALDKRWEQAVLPNGCRLMAIDDLADREHACDLLLDQNLGRKADDYAGLVPKTCMRLIGPEYALLRPQFARMREASLARRAQPQLKHLLVSMGGIDKDNATGIVLSSLRDCPLPENCRITVVLGANAPWLAQIEAQAVNISWPVELLVNVENMAALMVDSDLAIGAAGSTSWERCCLGLPALMVVIATNQLVAAEKIHLAGAARLLQLKRIGDTLSDELKKISDRAVLANMSANAAELVDGRGTDRVKRHILDKNGAKVIA